MNWTNDWPKWAQIDWGEPQKIKSMLLCTICDRLVDEDSALCEHLAAGLTDSNESASPTVSAPDGA